MTAPRVLLVEDDQAIQLALSDKLGFEGFEVTAEADGQRGWELLVAGAYDIILLDVMLPSVDGIEICRRMREAGDATPVLMLTARGLESDRVMGLEIGADDYVTKPFSVREVIARMRAMLRRREMDRAESAPPRPDRATFDGLDIHFDAFRMTCNGEEFDLSPTERDMLRLLVAQAGQVVSREQFLTDVWGLEAFPTTRTIDFHIRSLRRKIEPDPATPVWITTVHGVGYRFEPPVEGSRGLPS